MSLSAVLFRLTDTEATAPLALAETDAPVARLPAVTALPSEALFVTAPLLVTDWSVPRETPKPVRVEPMAETETLATAPVALADTEAPTPRAPVDTWAVLLTAAEFWEPWPMLYVEEPVRSTLFPE